MKKKNCSGVCALGWVATAVCLRSTGLHWPGVTHLGLELMYMLVALGFGLGVERLLKHWGGKIRIGAAGTLLPMALTVTVITLTVIYDRRELLYPLGVILLGIPMWTLKRTDAVLQDIVVTAVLVLWVLPVHQAEYLMAAGFYVLFAANTVPQFCGTDGEHAVIRCFSASMILGSCAVLKMYISGVPFWFAGEDLGMVLKFIGFTLIFFRPFESWGHKLKPAFHLIALALPETFGLLFWVLVFLGLELVEEQEEELDELGQAIRDVPTDRKHAYLAFRQVFKALETDDVSIGTWVFLWTKFSTVLPEQLHLRELRRLDRSCRSALLVAGYLESVAPADPEVWKLYETRFADLLPRTVRWKLRRIKRKCVKEDSNACT